MSYYNSAYSGSEYGEYNFNSYAVNYEYYHSPSFMTYNGYDYNQPNYGYDPNMYYPTTSTNYPLQSYQTIAYSATTFSDPKSIEYDPNYGMSQLVISYNTLGFNEPAFDEYDPTPYDGGYDIAKTYGKPLPPSDKICYPRSGSAPVESIVPLPKVEERDDEKAMIPQKVAEEEKPKEVEDKSYDDTHDMKPYVGEDSEEKQHEEDNGYSGGECDEKQVALPQYVPSGYGLEAMDICESMFGYWPCLSRMKREQELCDKGNNNMYDNMWKGSADYIFGNVDPYGGVIRREDGNSSSYGGSELVVYGYEYESHYLTQEQYRQIDYNDQSW
ncbi:PREDICTED: uncharacterized protein At5g39570 isoform X2 [Lupinus angustifolius]|uniref:uncharacterized protein At5g39570 isoform X2 n=1 Tax=Lupinus angustifolius TaxID=3871 RepID=UPI00092F7017|nr:PREDICTED: uncharacterized protein At5g39570 isoform X2 [Lupinus angustifolius]